MGPPCGWSIQCFTTLLCVATLPWTAGQEFLSYIELDSTPGVIRNSVVGDDACSNAITIPVNFHFGDLEHTTAYVCTNGLISFGTPMTAFTPSLFTSTSTVQPVVAPFWADISVTVEGNIWYEIHTDTTSLALLTQVNEFIRTQHQNMFTGTWMLVVEWNNVPAFDSPSPLNTFQGLVITDGFQSYTVFTYQCGDINWGGGATIGFKGDDDFFFNHPNSGNLADSIDCQGSATGNNVIYQLFEPIDVQCTHITNSALTIYTYTCVVIPGDGQQDTLVCTIDGVPIVPCLLMNNVSVFDFAPGNHTATITVNNTLGTSDSQSFIFVTPGTVGEWCHLMLCPDSRISRGLGTSLSGISMSIIVCCHGDATSSLIVYRPFPRFNPASVEKTNICDMMLA